MAIDTVVEEVATNLEEVAQVTRRINTKNVGFFMGGTLFGFVLGFYWGHKFNTEQIKAEAFRQSEEEIARMRDVYKRRTPVTTTKPSAEEIVEERGYGRPLKPPVPGLVDPTPVTPPPVVVYEGGKDKNRDWDYAEELKKRVDGEGPYIIHQDEFQQSELGYSQVTYTYYAGDDVLVDEGNGHPLPHADVIVGVDNLKFGHGTDDIDVVFVRNDKLEVEMEICRSPGSYEEEVLGVQNESDTSDASS